MAAILRLSHLGDGFVQWYAGLYNFDYPRTGLLSGRQMVDLQLDYKGQRVYLLKDLVFYPFRDCTNASMGCFLHVMGVKPQVSIANPLGPLLRNQKMTIKAGHLPMKFL